MNENKVEELLGAYALDALTPDEMEAVANHLRNCPEHAATARELRAVANMLAATADPLPPPPQLRGRIVDAVAAEPHAAASSSSPFELASHRDGGGRTSARVTWRPANILQLPVRAWASIAAVLVLALGGLLAWNLVLINRGTDANTFATRITSSSVLRSSGAAVVGNVLYVGDEHKAIILSDSLPQLDAAHAYQMWAVGDGNPKSLGLIRLGPGGRTIAVVDLDAARTATVVITVEPAAGSPQPTTSPAFTAKV